MVINHPKDHLLKMYAKKKNISGKKHQKKRKKPLNTVCFFYANCFESNFIPLIVNRS